MSILELGYQLLKELDIQYIHLTKNGLEIRYFTDNIGVISYGQTQNEAVENFYELYHDLMHKLSNSTYA